MAKSKLFVKNFRSGFLTPRDSLIFGKLRQAFIKVPIIYYFNPDCYIYIETNISSHVIGKDLNQLTLDDLNWWHPVVFFLEK